MQSSVRDLVENYPRRGRRCFAAYHFINAVTESMHAGTTSDMELRADTPLEKMKIVGVRPVQGTFEIYNAHIVSPSEPYRSVLFYRMAKLGRGRMPHVGSEFVDERGLRLIYDWIASLPGAKGR